MILISKEEKEIISSQVPTAHIVRTMKNKSKRHRYYCEESPAVMRVLNKFKTGRDSNDKGGDSYTVRKKRK